MMRARLYDLDILTSLAISLVVFGHLLIPEFYEISWYVGARELVYKFHMPLFMFLSGLLMAYTFKPVTDIKNYSSFLKKKILKFFPPYILFSSVFLISENFFGNGKWQNLGQDLFDIIFRPGKSPAGFIWYIYLLFEFYMIVPLLMRILKENVWLLLTLALIIHFIPLPSIFCLDLFGFYFLFIALGFVAIKYLNNYYMVLNRVGFLFLMLFIILLVINTHISLPKTVWGILSIPAFHYLSRLIEEHVPFWLTAPGRYSFYIYLMNTLIIGILAVIVFRYLKVEPNTFWLFTLFIFGLISPILIYKYLVRPVPVLNRIIQ